MVRPLPKRWLIHEIEYQEYIGENSWGKPEFSDPVLIKPVRIDNSTVFSRDSRETKILADAVIFVDAEYSKPSVEFKEQSRVKYGQKEYTIKKVVPCYYPDRDQIHHWELEVI